MVGNDIVDLRDPDSDTTSYSRRFDERVFSNLELSVIAGARDPERERWRMWAAKEASYKLARQQSAQTVFSPKKFVVEGLGSDERGDGGVKPSPARVTHGKVMNFVEFDESPDHIHAVAVSCLEDFDRVIRFVGEADAGPFIGVTESAAVRDLACREVSKHYGLAREALDVRKPSGKIPVLYHRGRPMAAHSLSLSHHGNWLAFACIAGEDCVA